MKISLDREAATLFVSFEEAAEQARFLAEAVEQGALMLPLAEPLELRSRWTVQLKSRAAGGVSLDTEPVHRFETADGGHQTAFELRGWDGSRVGELLASLGMAVPAAAAGAPPAAEPGIDEADGGGDSAGVDAEFGGEALGVSPAHRIGALNPNQRALLATRAGRVERQILIRDRTARVLEGLLANPRLEAKEALRIAKSTYATSAMLQRMAGDARWGQNLEIQTALAKNPKAPSQIVLSLIEKLRTSDLKRMANVNGGFREIVRGAALREYLKRTGGRGR